MRPENRLIGLDGLRGCLAIAVVLHHFGQISGIALMGAAWLSVDAFFILSGIVVGNSYEKRVLAGMCFREFLIIRFSRLYPMYFIGLMLGLLHLLVESFRGGINWADYLFRLPLALMVIPYPFDMKAFIPGNTPVFPINDPAWSLFFELFVSVFFFLIVVFFRGVSRIYFLFASFVTLLVAIHLFGISNGYSSSNFLGGFPRVVFFFLLGYFFYPKVRLLPRLNVLIAMPCLVFVALLFSFRNNILMFLGMFLFMPLVVGVFCAVNVPGSSIVEYVFRFLGNISFPLYITHFPVFKLLLIFDPFVRCSSIERVIFGLLISVGVAYFLSIYESGMRNYLSKMLMRFHA
ncbi:MAG: acyltransferase [Betaproteobacteria bacterium]|nr:acyltransferase [Betaproteobacteria bacterium]